MARHPSSTGWQTLYVTPVFNFLRTLTGKELYLVYLMRKRSSPRPASKPHRFNVTGYAWQLTGIVFKWKENSRWNEKKKEGGKVCVWGAAKTVPSSRNARRETLEDFSAPRFSHLWRWWHNKLNTTKRYITHLTGRERIFREDKTGTWAGSVVL